ncbi:hypothetical protein A5724_00280 [Mycobacterium sp. ACS1612]|uniref:hypothetical protein n=1 Tax=Mycobacterium sp. ACS1612 TaxID=1834117 RepID=UPI0007FBDC43|nr:hypothetical protein [Mycobacterium sp. ACS1612]OBF42208.1 hypothetical protein A5724_00280 [Mycobacterium sp. ACS1612]
MKTKLLAALSIAAAAALPAAAVANACGGGGDIPPSAEFVTPSGNIVCDIYGNGSGASCEVREHVWAVPASTRGPEGRACDFTFGGLQFYVSGGNSGSLGCYEGVSALHRDGLKTLDYGQTQSLGRITCASEQSGVTCTDTATGHFFQVSREDYELG